MATAAAASTFCVHVFVGEIHVARPLVADTALPKAAKWLAFYCWHLVTLMLAALSLYLLAVALSWVSAELAFYMGLFCIACSALSVLVAIKGGIAPWRFPSTSLFAITGGLTMLGAL